MPQPETDSPGVLAGDRGPGPADAEVGSAVRVTVLTWGISAWLAGAFGILAMSGLPGSREAETPDRRDLGAPVSAVAFSRDGRRLAAATEDGVLALRDWASRRETVLWRGRVGVMRSLSFAPDGKTVAAAGRGRGVRFWGVDAGRLMPSGDEEARPSLWDDGTAESVVAFSPDGATLAAAGRKDGTVHFLDPRTGRARSVWGGGGGPVNVLAFSPDGRTLAAAGADGIVRLWDTGAGLERVAFRAHRDGVWSLTFSPDGATLATAGPLDRAIRLWDATTGRPRKSFSVQSLMGGLAVAFSPRREILATGGRAGEVRLWDAEGGRPLAVLNGHTSSVLCLAFSPDGATLATGSVDRTLRLWDVARALAGEPAEVVDPVATAPSGGR